MKTRLLTTLLPGFCALASTLTAQDNLEETRDVLEQWVETRQILSEEKSDWKTEKAILNDTVSLLSNELERLEAAIAELEESTTAADAERTELTEKRDQLNAGSEAVIGNIGAIETQLKAIIAELPEPLTDTIQPLIRRLPNDPEKTKLSLGERVQNVVGILSQADKFNKSIKLTSDVQELDNGKRVQVNTLYWGTAIAYFVDDSGTYGGFGVPSESGWEWTEVEGAGPALVDLFAVNDGSADTIEFIQVPASIK